MQRTVTESFSSPRPSASPNEFFNEYCPREAFFDAVWESIPIRHPELLSDPQEIRRALVNAGPAAKLYHALVARFEEMTERFGKEADVIRIAGSVETIAGFLESNPLTGERYSTRTVQRDMAVLEALRLGRRVFRSVDEVDKDGVPRLKYAASLWLVAGCNTLSETRAALEDFERARRAWRERQQHQKDADRLAEEAASRLFDPSDEMSEVRKLGTRNPESSIQLPHPSVWDDLRFPRKNRGSRVVTVDIVSLGVDSDSSWPGNREPEESDSASEAGDEFESWPEHESRRGRRTGLIFGDLAERLKAHREERKRARVREALGWDPYETNEETRQ